MQYTIGRNDQTLHTEDNLVILMPSISLSELRVSVATSRFHRILNLFTNSKLTIYLKITTRLYKIGTYLQPCPLIDNQEDKIGIYVSHMNLTYFLAKQQLFF